MPPYQVGDRLIEPGMTLHISNISVIKPAPEFVTIPPAKPEAWKY
jgi:hypothetical protein